MGGNVGGIRRLLLFDFLGIWHADKQFGTESIDFVWETGEMRDWSVDGDKVDWNAGEDDGCAHCDRYCGNVARGDNQEAARDQENQRESQMDLKQNEIFK